MLAITMSSWEVLLTKGQEWDWFGDPFLCVQTLALLFVLGLGGLIFRELLVGAFVVGHAFSHHPAPEARAIIVAGQLSVGAMAVQNALAELSLHGSPHDCGNDNEPDPLRHGCWRSPIRA